MYGNTAAEVAWVETRRGDKISPGGSSRTVRLELILCGKKVGNVKRIVDVTYCVDRDGLFRVIREEVISQKWTDGT